MWGLWSASARRRISRPVATGGQTMATRSPLESLLLRPTSPDRPRRLAPRWCGAFRLFDLHHRASHRPSAPQRNHAPPWCEAFRLFDLHHRASHRPSTATTKSRAAVVRGVPPVRSAPPSESPPVCATTRSRAAVVRGVPPVRSAPPSESPPVCATTKSRAAVVRGVPPVRSAPPSESPPVCATARSRAAVVRGVPPSTRASQRPLVYGHTKITRRSSSESGLVDSRDPLDMT